MSLGSEARSFTTSALGIALYGVRAAPTGQTTTARRASDASACRTARDSPLLPTSRLSATVTLIGLSPSPQSTGRPDHRFRLPRVRQANIRDDRQRIVEPWREVGIGDIGRPQALTADDLVQIGRAHV